MVRSRSAAIILMTILVLGRSSLGQEWTPRNAFTSFGETVEPEYRETVLRIVHKPTISTQGRQGEVACTAEMYSWLLEHPDRVALAWKRLRVPCVDIHCIGPGRFLWTDENGSQIAWQTVGRTTDGLIWYATGKIKPTAVLPMIPVKAVAVVSRCEQVNRKGETVLFPHVSVYLHTDSRAAQLILRMLGPTAPRLAEQGAEQLLFFFNGIGNHLARNPEQTDILLAPAKK